MIITSEILAQYQNGNCDITLYKDGAKRRSWPDGEEPHPAFPESIDLKITDWCDGGCPFCHESSTKKGKHATPRAFFRLRGLPRGVELAIGGGDPLSHPGIMDILSGFRKAGLISSITVNGQHIEHHLPLLLALRDSKLIFGLGVTWTPDLIIRQELQDPRNVLHVIGGVHPPTKILATKNSDEYSKMGWALPDTLLILGYKSWGRGANKAEADLHDRIMEWRWRLDELAHSFKILCMDNLALEQLGLGPTWYNKSFYMGGDGEFSMYVDLVTQSYAKNSTSPRIPFKPGETIQEAFAEIRRDRNETTSRD